MCDEGYNTFEYYSTLNFCIMKKSILGIALLSLLFSTSYAQTNNKPEANSFGIQYGVNFGSNVSQSVLFTGFLKDFEIRGGTTFSINGTNTVNDNSSPGEINKTTNRSNAISFSPGVSIVKHIPIKGNLDFYVGGSANVGFSMPTSNTYYSYENSYTNYYSYISTDTKNPITLTFGLGVVGGTNFFFYKNLALGAEFSAGFNANTLTGRRTSTETDVNYGSSNANTNNGTYTTSYKSTSFNYNLSFVGYAGLHLTYYLRVKDKKKYTDQKM